MVVSMDVHTQSIGNITPDGRYSYTNDLLSLRAAVPQLPAECSRIVSPLQVEVWEKHLQDHPDRDFVGYLLDGIIDKGRGERDWKRKRIGMQSAFRLRNPDTRVRHIRAMRERVRLGTRYGPIARR